MRFCLNLSKNLSFLFLLFHCSGAFAYTEAEGRNAWKKIRNNPVTEQSFREVCDLAQDIGKTHLNVSYEILADYLPKVRKTGNKRWIHILLMGWAKAKGSLAFFEEAEKLYQQARENAQGTGRMYREALVGTVLLYGEWEHPDSSKKYIDLGEKACIKAGDKENLSFIYTFKAASDVADTASMRIYFDKAIKLATGLSNKNALFTARYNYANVYLQKDLRKKVAVFESLIEMAKDSSLHRYPRKLYERTAFTFRSAGPSVYYQLMQLNLLMTDFASAGKFAELFYDATIKPNPEGAQAAYFNAEMALVRSYQKDFKAARTFLETSKRQFKLPEDKIPYISYAVAAGLLAEHDGKNELAEKYYGKFVSGTNFSHGLHILPVELQYAHILTVNGKFQEAKKVFGVFGPAVKSQKFSATGYYYYLYLSKYYQAMGNAGEYARSLNTYYEIKDSLTNLNQYRTVQEILAKVRLKDKEQQIEKLNMESELKLQEIRRERIFYGVVITFTTIIIILLTAYLRNRQVKNRQEAALRKGEEERLEKQRHIELMHRVMDASENERKKIAGQLHDEVSSMIALASLSVTSTLEKGRADVQSEDKLIKTQEILSSVSSTIRDLSHQLNPITLEKYGFRKAVEEAVEIINLSGQVALESVIVGFENMNRYPQAVLTDVYRIVQELLHNIVKHAKASTARLELIEHEEVISIFVEDNGVGLNIASSQNGHGLATMKSRVALVNGLMEVSNKPEGGTMVVIEINT